MNDGEGICNLLKNPLSLRDLMGSGAKFEINFDEGSIHNIYEEVYESDGTEDDDVEVDKDLLVSPFIKAFAELKTEMIAINEYIFKKITDPGSAEKKDLMPDKSRVRIRYNAYWEGDGASFDSSYLRGSSFSFYTGCGSVLKGLEMAVRTMREGEKAQFIISYKLLFGEMGCPPRIRPRADGLFIVELMAFNAVGDINAEEQLSEEDEKKYSVVMEKVKQIHLKGLDFFGQRINACRAFEKAADALIFCHLTNEEEGRDQEKFLLKLYTNLAVCYNKINLPKRTCIICLEIRRLTNNKPSCKALFQEGRAMVNLGEYAKARDFLVGAQQLEPQNNSIGEELKNLDIRCKKYKENKKMLWQTALGIQKDTNNEVVEKSCSELKKNMLELLEDYKKSNIQKNFKLPEGLSDQDTETIQELSKQFDMQMVWDATPRKAHSIC